MKLVSWNINGIRAAARRGCEQTLISWGADVVSLQEVKARPEQVPESLRHLEGYHAFWSPAERAGYSGVAVFTKTEPEAVYHGIEFPEGDAEGRVLTLVFKDFVLVNGYFPHSRHDHSRLAFKLAFCDALLNWLKAWEARGKAVVLCGDYNIAHQDIDLANPRTNRENPGFLPEERAWMDRLLAAGYRDVFREKTGPVNGHYSWWSYRKGVRERNVGWRIDYHCVHQSLIGRVADVGHLTEVMGSDHCPVYLSLQD